MRLKIKSHNFEFDFDGSENIGQFAYIKAMKFFCHEEVIKLKYEKEKLERQLEMLEEAEENIQNNHTENTDFELEFASETCS